MRGREGGGTIEWVGRAKTELQLELGSKISVPNLPEDAYIQA